MTFRHDLDLAVVGNCRIAALVDCLGRVCWMCFPRLDGDPVFSSLLEPDETRPAGFWDVLVEGGQTRPVSQRYRGNTAVLETVLAGDSGAVRVIDFAPRFKHWDRVFRPATLVRRLEPVDGAPTVRIRLRPGFGYGSLRPGRTFGSNHMRFVAADQALRLTTDAPIAYVAGEHPMVLDGPVNLILGADESLTASIPDTVRRFLESTETYWQEWCRYLSVPFEWQDTVIRAAITLKLCAYEETGAVIAALTTSIPEAPGTERTWDYRFCWLRDAYFTVRALNRLGATLTMEEFIRYITHVVALEPGRRLKPVYPVVPEEGMEERQVEGLGGYRGMGPVRVGNAAAGQVQNDSYGSVILATAQMFYDHRLPARGDKRLFHLLAEIGERAAASALSPDAGLWEYRGRARVHTHSSVMCWAACDRLAGIAGLLGMEAEKRAWRGKADAIREAVLARAWNPRRNSFVDSLDGEELDASLLLLAEIGFISPQDPRFLATVAAVEKGLTNGGTLLRYSAADDFGVPTTSFTACTFWYIDALAQTGRWQEARDVFQHVLGRRTRLGLLSEDIDPTTGELWGNFPQTYCMVGVILSAMRLSRRWEEGLWDAS
jgi:GH15 family glucan-1,4-alpha-glucosidase